MPEVQIEEWAIRFTDVDGTVKYVTHHTPGWGTRFQEPSRPYSPKSALHDLTQTTEFISRPDATIVHRTVVRIEGEWEESLEPERKEHERWVNIDWDDSGKMRSWTVRMCNCLTPWTHRP